MVFFLKAKILSRSTSNALEIMSFIIVKGLLIIHSFLQGKTEHYPQNFEFSVSQSDFTLTSLFEDYFE